MDKDLLLDELLENRAIVQSAKLSFDDINKELPIELAEFISHHITNAVASMDVIQNLYEKEINMLGGNY